MRSYSISNSTLETLFNKIQGSLNPGWYKSLEDICSRCKKSSLKQHVYRSAPHLWVNSNFLFHTKESFVVLIEICLLMKLNIHFLNFCLVFYLVLQYCLVFSRAGWAPAIEIMIITCLFCFLCITESFGCLNWRHYINLRLLLLKKKGVKKKSTKL